MKSNKGKKEHPCQGWNNPNKEILFENKRWLPSVTGMGTKWRNGCQMGVFYWLLRQRLTNDICIYCKITCVDCIHITIM